MIYIMRFPIKSEMTTDNKEFAKLKDSEGEAAETQVWLEFSYNHKYINKTDFDRLTLDYNNIIGKLVIMANQPEKWKI